LKKDDVFWALALCRSCENRRFGGRCSITTPTGHPIPEGGTLHSFSLENFKSYIALTGWAL
jgi:hypothetical protein